MPPVARSAMAADRPEAAARQQRERTHCDKSMQPQTAVLSSSDRRVQDTLQLVKEIWKPLRKSNAAYVGQHERVIISPLSFTTGHTQDGADQFLRLASSDDIDRVLTPSDLAIDPGSTNIWQARFIYFYFSNLLSNNKDETLPSLIDRIRWVVRSPKEKDCLFRVDFDANVHFGAAAIWDQYDPSKPHKICYLLDEAPLREGVLSASELNAIMAITAGRFLNKHYNHHRVVPVTLVTGSGTSVRITQSHVDIKGGKVKVYMTETVDFAAGPIERWKEVLTVLSWLTATPTGSTM